MDTSSVIWISSSTCQQQTLQPLSKWAFDAVFSIALVILKRYILQSLIKQHEQCFYTSHIMEENKTYTVLLKSQFFKLK